MMAGLPPDRVAPPDELVTAGRYNFGTYDAPIGRINPLDATNRLPRFVNNLRLKEWEAFQVGNDHWFGCGAVYSAKLLALVQFIVVERATGRIHRWLRKVPATSVKVTRGLDGTTSVGRSGAFDVTVENRLGIGEIEVRARHPGGPGLPSLDLHVVGRCPPDVAPHLVICHPFAANRALYSDKATMPATGSMRIGTESVAFDGPSAFLLLDDHKGDYPAPMAYDWVTGARGGEPLVSFNLTSNQVLDPEVHNENAVFVSGGDGRAPAVHRLPPVTVDRPGGPHEPWHITDRHGTVDVEFTPEVRSEMHVGPRHALAEYYGPYGSFSGRISPTGQVSFALDGFYGMGEQKRIRF